MKPRDMDSFLAEINAPDFEDAAKREIPTLTFNTDAERDILALNRLVSAYNAGMQNAGIDKWFIPNTAFSIENCPKHRAFFNATKKYTEVLFCAGNRCGKSLAGAYATACHLTGEYPLWWDGITFDHPIQAWAAGSDAKSTRDTVQKELLGAVGELGTGLIPLEKIGRQWALSGVPQGVDMVKIKHVSGGWSTLSFKNYQQAISAFYGTSIHWIWLDEIAPHEIYNECLIRTMTTGGRVCVTFTPLEGITPLIVSFFSKADLLVGSRGLKGVSKDAAEELEQVNGVDARLAERAVAKCIITAGWDDAPWLTEESKARMLDDTPVHLKAARSLGEPAMGSGNVYPIPLESILVKPFEIPDYYERLYALDVGWNRTACIWAARNPDTGIVYLYDEHYVGQAEPAIHAQAIHARGKWMEGVIDPAARGRSQIDGMKLMDVYKELGLLIYPARNEVEGGIQMVYSAVSSGKLKVFETLTNWQREYTLYRRDLNGKIIKEHDHLMDATRYVYNNQIRFLSRKNSRIGATPIYTGAITYDI